MSKNVFLLGATFSLLGNVANAQPNLSLESLLNLTTSVASKSEVKQSDAPGIISVYEAEDIERMGIYTIADLADVTPGYGSVTFYGERALFTRGMMVDNSFDSGRHLLLIDGIPANHARNGKIWTEEEVNLFGAKKVEFLKGPASALYGTGAFYGVVNYVSKEAKEDGTKLETRVNWGTHGSERNYSASAVNRSEAGKGKLIVSHYTRKAQKDLAGSGYQQATSDTRVNDWKDSYFINGSYTIKSGALKGFTPGYIHIEKTSGTGEYWGTAPSYNDIRNQKWSTTIPYLKFNRGLTENFSLSSYVKHNRSIDQVYKEDKWGVSKKVIYSYEGLLEGRYQIAEDSDLIIGANYTRAYEKGKGEAWEYDRTDGAGNVATDWRYIDTFSKDFPALNTYSAYTQYTNELGIGKGMLLTLGARYDKSKDKTGAIDFDQFSPRGAIVQRLTDRMNLKVLYGAALKSPGAKESSINQQVLEANPIQAPANVEALVAESIQSFEVGMTYDSESVSSGLTASQTETKNAIFRDWNKFTGDNGGDVSPYGNKKGKAKGYAIEFDFKWILSESFRLFTNYTWSLTRVPDSDGNDARARLANVPNQNVNFGLSHHMFVPFDLESTLLVKHIDNYTASGERWLVGGTQIDMNFVSGLSQDLDLEFKVQNILDREEYYPFGGDERYPKRGRSFNFGLKYIF